MGCGIRCASHVRSVVPRARGDDIVIGAGVGNGAEAWTPISRRWNQVVKGWKFELGNTGQPKPVQA